MKIIKQETITDPTPISSPINIDEPQTPKTPKTTKTKKRKQYKIDEDDAFIGSSNSKNVKGVILSVKKPSYTLKRGVGVRVRSLRCQHRNRLRYLLRKLLRRQNWDEATGVLSLLLKGTYRDGSVSFNRFKYSATLKLLEHIGAAKGNAKKLKDVYKVWINKDCVPTKNEQSMKGGSAVHLESLLFFLSIDDTNEAETTVTNIRQRSDFSNDPIANLHVGLYYSHKWYNAIRERLCLHNSLESSSLVQSGMSDPRDFMPVDYSHAQSDVIAQESASAIQVDSNTSIRFGKEGVDQDREGRIYEHDIKKETIEFDEPDMNSSESGQNGNSSRFPHTGNTIYGSIVYAHELEDLLMPIRLPRTNTLEEFISLQNSIQNDDYKASVKYLHNALHCTPPAFEALLPLIQMLLLGDQVKEAVEEVESVVQISQAALPFRLKASLLEHFSKEDASKLGICFEDALTKDPTCSHSLSKLINMHHNGFYSIERLIEMIAMHLDAKYADCDVWREFASCFLKLSQCDDDRMSCCDNSYGDSYNTKSTKNIPDMFQDDVSRKNWRVRSRWWRTRHFTQTMLASELTSGNLELVAYKAASACHIYGPEFSYTVTAYKHLKSEKSQEMSNLKMHMENAIGFTQHNTDSLANSYTKNVAPLHEVGSPVSVMESNVVL